MAYNNFSINLFGSGSGGGGGGGGGGGTGAVTVWDTTTAYTVGACVLASNALWIARANNTNSSPSLAGNNWRRISDFDTSNSRYFCAQTNANYTWSKGVFSLCVTALTADITITLSAISSFADSDSTNRIQEFILIKQTSANTVNLNCTAPNTFHDSTTSKQITASSVTRFILDFVAGTWRII